MIIVTPGGGGGEGGVSEKGQKVSRIIWMAPVTKKWDWFNQFTHNRHFSIMQYFWQWGMSIWQRWTCFFNNNKFEIIKLEQSIF